MLQRTITALAILFTVFALPSTGFAQPTWTLDPFGKEKKPEQYENRKLGSEKTAEKKFTPLRHFIQNNVTHYNYYFNANSKVNLVVEKAKFSHKDDYGTLLSFYPYTLEATAAQKTDLDSVIYTSTAGILIHDLRNDWIDNMYLLIGKAYYFRKEFDSASMTFQFINYNLFPRKKHEDDNKVVGSNSSASGSSISIADKEKRNIIQRVMTLPPSRNDALIWLARTSIEMGEYGEAGGLINTLQNDPNLPKRLCNDLDEVAAYLFFKQGGFDSSAAHLERALSNADDKIDKSRREYLLAQLFEMNHQFDKASTYYLKAAKHTVDPLMDIYARLNNAKMLKGGNLKELDKTIDNLAKMARKDKYDTYRDIMYYAAGQISLQKPDTTLALSYFRKSLKYNEDNLPYKNRAFLQLADIAFSRKQYRIAASLYDSVQTNDTTLAERAAQIDARKSALSKIVEAITNIEREDSLQRIAGMQPAERDDYIKKLLRRLRKESGLKDDNSNNRGNDFNNPFADNRAPQDLFAGNSPKGEWYFNNPSMKGKGFNEFKRNWGNRTNVDNWRRVVVTAPNASGKTPGVPDVKDKNGNIIPGTAAPEELTYESLAKNIPLTDEKKAASNETIATNLFNLGKTYQNELEEYELAVDTYENYLQRFPTRLLNGELYLAMYHCYSKLGNKSKADYYKNLLTGKFANTPSGKLLTMGSSSANVKNPAATKRYEQIYDLFIEGNFDAAIAQKKAADTEFGVNYWTPQLLYIEALYYVKQRNDSVAIAGLQNIISFYPTSPLKAKAENMIDVLRRRAEIETYLTNLQVTRVSEDSVAISNDPLVSNKPPVVVPVAKDSTKKVEPPKTNGTFTMSPASPHYVLMLLDKVDATYVNEAKNALARYNNEKFYGQPIVINKDPLDATRNMLIISSFADADAALQYYGKLRNDVKNEISWLPAAKYSFLIITEPNLQLLKTNKDITGYKTLLNSQYPNRF